MLKITKEKLILLVILCLFFPLFGFSLDIYLPTRYEVLFGMWVNPDYPTDSMVLPQKITMWNWGYGEAFYTIESDKPFERWTQIILSKKQDSEGATWYRTYVLGEGGSTAYIYLFKVSKDGRKLEYIWAIDMYIDLEKSLPESALVPDNPHYMSYTRYVRK
jgi:hypothetical protein